MNNKEAIQAMLDGEILEYIGDGYGDNIFYDSNSNSFKEETDSSTFDINFYNFGNGDWRIKPKPPKH